MSHDEATQSPARTSAPAGVPDNGHPRRAADCALELIEHQLDTMRAEEQLDGGASVHGTAGSAIATRLTASYSAVRSLFIALAYRDRSTADHSWRVAAQTYRFARYLGLPASECLAIEVAGLLHDVGKIGVPDSILLKPARLSAEEQAIMAEHHRMSVDIMRPTIPVSQVIDAVEQSHGWFDGSRSGFARRGYQIPLGARILTIVDAFDAMTCDRVYRGALGRDEALHRLIAAAGNQFDPALVKEFHNFAGIEARAKPEAAFTSDIAALLGKLPYHHRSNLPGALEYYTRVLNDVYDGVCFLHRDGRVLFWNDRAEELTGYSAAEMCSSTERRRAAVRALETIGVLGDLDLLEDSLADGAPRIERVLLQHRSGDGIPVEAHVVPIVCGLGDVIGAALLLRDVRDQVALEEQCRTLAVQAVQDPLTGVTNRAEFDRRLLDMIGDRRMRGNACSLVVADLDYFKEINDTFGHQCGDEVLKCFSKILMAHRRQEDSVARYGGEEFIVLLPNCPIDVAWRRAEAIRRDIGRASIPGLRGRNVTSSFGVTQFHLGDSAESFVNRADRALYLAKQQGRNRTVKIDVAGAAVEQSLAGTEPDADGRIETTLALSSAGETALLKLSGFVADHGAQIVYQDEQTLRLRVGGRNLRERLWPQRHNLPIEINLNFSPPRQRNRTLIRLEMKPEVPRRLLKAAHERCQTLLVSLRAYLMVD